MKMQNEKEITKMIALHPLQQRRIFSIVAHIDHGKSTVADFLLKRAGLISRSRSQSLGPAISMTEEEKERSITMYTSVVTLAFDLDNRNYLFQFNDTPGHISFTGEVSRALRSSDGVVVVVDALEGIMPQTITNMELAIQDEVCRPVLFINKVDRLISELELSVEEIGTKLNKIVNDVNELIKLFTKDLGLSEDWTLHYADNQVAIGSAKDGWAFTHDILHEQNLTVDEVVQHYRIDDKNWLQNNLSLDESLLRIIVEHCPDPKTAQQLKIPKIWNGDVNSLIGQSLKNCDKNGPTVGTVTKIILDDHSNQITLVGRLFSGELRSSDILYLHGRKENQRIKRLGIMEITDILNVDVIPAGCLFAVTGLNCQAGETISHPGIEFQPFEDIVYVAEPVISRAIAPVKITDQIKLHELLRKWLLVDPTLSLTDDSKDNRMIIHGIDPLQIEVLISRLESKIPLEVSEPSILHRETISHESDDVITKSNNAHNRISVIMKPMSEDLTIFLKSGQLGKFMTSKEVANLIASNVSDYDEKFFRGYWAHNGTNLLIDATKGVQRLDRIKEFTIQAWSDFVDQGTLAGDHLHGTLLIITDAKIHVDPSHSGISEIVSMVSAACNLSFLQSNPTLLEPLMRLRIKAPVSYMGKLESMLHTRRGSIRDFVIQENTSSIVANIPATELNDLAEVIRDITSGTAIFGYEFDDYQLVPEQLLDERIKSIRLRNNLSIHVPDGSSWNKLIYK